MRRLILLIVLLNSLFINAQELCDSLEIVSVTFDPLSMESIVIEVSNSSFEIFSYPGWRVYDENDNLIGEEMVNFFGIGESSVHNVPHEIDVEPGESIPLTLELWTGFYDTLVCTFENEFVLQPIDGCATLLFSYSHSDELSVAQDIVYTIQSDEGEIVSTDQVSLAGGFDYQVVDQCLAPGCYTITYSPAEQLFQSPVGVTISYPGWFSDVPVAEELNTGDPQTVLEFGVWGDCEDVVDNIMEKDYVDIGAYPNPTTGLVRFEGIQGHANAVVFDLFGNRVAERSLTSGSADLTGVASGCYLVQILENGQYHLAKLVVQN